MVIGKFVLNGYRGGGVIYLWHSILTRGSLYIENCNTLPIWIVTGLYIYHTNTREKCLLGNSKKFVLGGCRGGGGGSYFYRIVY